MAGKVSCPRECLSRSRGMRNLQRTTRELQILIQVAYVEKLFKLLGQGEVQMKGGEYSISFLPRMKGYNIILSTQSPREQCRMAALMNESEYSGVQ